MSKLDNLSHYEEKTLSSDKCPICNSDLYIISNWMDMTFDGPQWEYCESNEEHVFSKPPRSYEYYQMGIGDKRGEIIKTFKPKQDEQRNKRCACDIKEWVEDNGMKFKPRDNDKDIEDRVNFFIRHILNQNKDEK